MKKRGKKSPSRKRNSASAPAKIRRSARAENELASQTSGEASPAARKVAPVVGIGASAGALEAFSRLLRA
jgi:chemotaxis response regulator CheB